MESNIGPLVYPPLPSRFIRLFGINPGTPNDPISGILVRSNIDALNNDFQAISYTWGTDIDETAIVTVRDVSTGHTGTITITVSLWNILRSIRNPRGPIGVWVDQICIDQTSMQEKSEQILLMRLIYQRANRVLAFVQNSDEVNFAMDLLAGAEWFKTEDFTLALDAALTRLGQEVTASNRTNAFNAMSLLIGERYWKRAWIWQEACAQPDSCVIGTGTKYIYLRNMVRYMLSYREYTATKVEVHKDWNDQVIIDMTQFIDFWGLGRTGMDRSLLSLLDQIRETDATDPRDKIFAVLPFSSDANDEIEPTYNRLTWEVYTMFAIWQMVKYQSFDVISFSRGELSRIQGLEETNRLTTTVGQQLDVKNDTADGKLLFLGSWVPDWRARRRSEATGMWQSNSPPVPLPKAEHMFDSSLPRLYNAGGLNSISLRFESLNTHMVINGLVVEAVKVATLAHVQNKRTPGLVSLEVEEDWYRNFKTLNISNWTYNGDHLFKRTIYADVTFQIADPVYLWARAKSPDSELTWPHRPHENAYIELGCLKQITRSRGPFCTKANSEENNGLYGLGPLWALPGDELWILKGASVPFILRTGHVPYTAIAANANLISGSIEQEQHHEGDPVLVFVGECFVLGLMDGEVLDLMQLDEHDSRRAQVPELERDFHPITLY